jgi:hypothetical protein
MLDRRAWIIACLIVLIAAVAYIVWLYRPKATYNARSLSASHQPAASKSQAKSLHVDGCQEDFIVSPGELIQPQIVPGASLDQARSQYGPEAKHDKSGILTWNQWEYSLTDGYFGPDSPQNFVNVSLNAGHIVETLDGIELGLDSMGTIFRKMRDKKVEVHERLAHSDKGWTLTVSLYSACGRKFRSEYTRTLPEDPEINRQIAAKPAETSENTGDSGLLHSDAFMNKVVYEYKLVPSSGQNDTSDGSPSQHD